MSEIRRRVVGETWISIDTEVSRVVTKNTAKSVIHRSLTRAILLDCGHAIEVTRFNKVPTSNTRCRACELLAPKA